MGQVKMIPYVMSQELLVRQFQPMRDRDQWMLANQRPRNLLNTYSWSQHVGLHCNIPRRWKILTKCVNDTTDVMDFN